MRFEDDSQEDDTYNRHHTETADVMKKISSVFDSSCTVRIQVQDGVIRFSTLLSATSNAHTVLCMHLRDLPITVRTGHLSVLVRTSLLSRIYGRCDGSSKWRWSVEDDAISGKHNLVIERIEANVAEAGVVYKVPIKRDERGDPDLEIGIPDRIVNMQAALVVKLANLLAHWGRRSKWITLKAYREAVTIKGNDDLLSFSMSIQQQQQQNAHRTHEDNDYAEVTVDCKQFYRSLLPVRLEPHAQADISLGISQDALTVKVNSVGKWTCASILAIKLSE